MEKIGYIGGQAMAAMGSSADTTAGPRCVVSQRIEGRIVIWLDAKSQTIRQTQIPKRPEFNGRNSDLVICVTIELWKTTYFKLCAIQKRNVAN